MRKAIIFLLMLSLMLTGCGSGGEKKVSSQKETSSQKEVTKDKGKGVSSDLLNSLDEVNSIGRLGVLGYNITASFEGGHSEINVHKYHPKEESVASWFTSHKVEEYPEVVWEFRMGAGGSESEHNFEYFDENLKLIEVERPIRNSSYNTDLGDEELLEIQSNTKKEYMKRLEKTGVEFEELLKDLEQRTKYLMANSKLNREIENIRFGSQNQPSLDQSIGNYDRDTRYKDFKAIGDNSIAKLVALGASVMGNAVGQVEVNMYDVPYEENLSVSLYKQGDVFAKPEDDFAYEFIIGARDPETLETNHVSYRIDKNFKFLDSEKTLDEIEALPEELEEIKIKGKKVRETFEETLEIGNIKIEELVRDIGQLLERNMEDFKKDNPQK